MADNLTNWKELAKEIRGEIAIPGDADTRIEMIIEKFGHRFSVKHFGAIINASGTGEVLERDIKDGSFDNVDEAIVALCNMDLPDQLRVVRDLIKDEWVLDFDFESHRIGRFLTSTDQILCDVQTPRDMVQLAKDEVIWTFFAVYIIVNHILPLF